MQLILVKTQFEVRDLAGANRTLFATAQIYVLKTHLDFRLFSNIQVSLSPLYLSLSVYSSMISDSNFAAVQFRN